MNIGEIAHPLKKLNSINNTNNMNLYHLVGQSQREKVKLIYNIVNGNITYTWISKQLRNKINSNLIYLIHFKSKYYLYFNITIDSVLKIIKNF
jgi:uncharacterized pyridoxal phosphate-containing UPF0001 family protein